MGVDRLGYMLLQGVIDDLLFMGEDAMPDHLAIQPSF